MEIKQRRNQSKASNNIQLQLHQLNNENNEYAKSNYINSPIIYSQSNLATGNFANFEESQQPHVSSTFKPRINQMHNPTSELRSKSLIRGPPRVSVLDHLNNATFENEYSHEKITGNYPKEVLHEDNQLTYPSMSYENQKNLYVKDTNESTSIVSQQDTQYYTWIIVSGFHSTTNYIEIILQRFQVYGDILDYRIGLGNWIFIK